MVAVSPMPKLHIPKADNPPAGDANELARRCDRYAWLAAWRTHFKTGVEAEEIYGDLMLLVSRNAAQYDPTWTPSKFVDLQLRFWLGDRTKKRRRRADKGWVEPVHLIRDSYNRNPWDGQVDVRADDPADLAAANEERDDAAGLVEHLLSQLDPADATEVRRRFGIGIWREHHNGELGRARGQTRASAEIRQVKILDQLRQMLGLPRLPRMVARETARAKAAQEKAELAKKKPKAKSRKPKKPPVPHALTGASKSSPARRTKAHDPARQATG